VTFPFDVTELALTNEALFEAVARLNHPDVEAVLTLLGRHAADKFR
jgi:hypothetical protein